MGWDNEPVPWHELQRRMSWRTKGDGDLLAVEHYRLVRGEVGSPFDADGHETDLFAGVTT